MMITSALNIAKILIFISIFSVPSIAFFSFFGLPNPEYIFPAMGIIPSLYSIILGIVCTPAKYKPVTWLSSIFLMYLIIKLLAFSVDISLRSFIDLYFFYIIPIAVLSISMCISCERSFLSLFKFLWWCIFALILIGVAQFILRDNLPNDFIQIPNSHGSYLVNVIEIDDGLMIRPNMLLGTSMVVGTFLILAQVMNFLLVENISRFKFHLFNLLSFMLVVLTFSRVAILGYFLIISGYLISRGCFSKYVLIFSFLFSLCVLFILNFFTDSFIAMLLFYTLDRMLDLGSQDDHSSQQHIEDYIESLKVFVDNPIIGIPFGQASAIITDGAFFHYLLDLGILGFILASILTFSILILVFSSVDSKKQRPLVFALLGFALLSLLANSSFLARANSSLLACIAIALTCRNYAKRGAHSVLNIKSID